MSTLRPRKIIAHRGAQSLAPENTMIAFRKALEVGADGFELDLSVTKDGELIVFHDDYLDRTSNIDVCFPEKKDNPLHWFSIEELKQLDVGSWFIASDPSGEIGAGNVSESEQEEMVGATIPTLKEVLVFAIEHSLYVNIEMKILPSEIASFPIVEKVIQLINELQIEPESFAISSFAHDYLRQVQEKRPDIEINALIGRVGSNIQDWGNFEFAIYNANANYIDQEQIEKVLSKGCQFNLFTVNEVSEMQRFLKAGASKIITDFPQRMVNLTN